MLRLGPRGLWRRAGCSILLPVVAGMLLAASAGAADEGPRITLESARLGHVFSVNESPALVVSVSARQDAALDGVLDLRVRDAYGRLAGREKMPIRLAPGASMAHVLTIGRARLGHFTVKAVLRGADRSLLARGGTTAGVVPPLDGVDAGRSGVGYMILPRAAEAVRAREVAAQMRRLGIRAVRMNFDWWWDDRGARPDFADPKWLDSAAFEAWVEAFHENGIEVLAVLFGCARWAVDPNMAGLAAHAWARVPSLESGDWQRFVTTLANRVRGRVRSWELWNEPDLAIYWAGSPERFVALLHETAGELRAVDPENRVVVNLVDADTEEGLRFLDGVLAGAGDALDMFGFHYGRGNLVWAARRLAPGVRFWNTENWGLPRRHVSRWLSERARGIERVFTFIYHTTEDDTDVYGFRRFGRSPVNVDYTPRFDAIALRTLSDQVGSAQPVGFAPAGLGYVAYTFARPDGPVVALADDNEIGDTWSVGGGVRLWLSVPRGVRRITTVDLMGNARTLRVRNGRLRLKLQGVAVFLRPEPGESLTGLQVRRARRAGAR